MIRTSDTLPTAAISNFLNEKLIVSYSEKLKNEVLEGAIRLYP